MFENKFIDTRNIDYDYDLTKEFTWEFRDLVEIKKRKRVVDTVISPTVKSLTHLMSKEKRDKAIKRKALVTKRKEFENFNLYEFFPDKYAEKQNDDKKK